MLKLTGRFVGYKFDRRAYERRVSKFLDRAIRTGVRRWIRGTTKKVPVWSGMSRASLLIIAELANGRVNITGLQARSRIPEGRALGLGRIEDGPVRWVATIGTRVPHYVLQEHTNVRPRGSPSAPWESFAAGQAEFDAYAETVTLPAPRIGTKVIATVR